MEVEIEEPKKVSWWLRRTRIEKCLIVLSTIFGIIIIYLASNLLMTFPGSKENVKKNVCMTEKCIATSAKYLSTMDRSVNPCENFFNFVCGNFMKSTIIPDHKYGISTTTDMSDKVTLQLMKLFEEPMRHNDTHFSNLTKILYKSCMDTEKIEAAGIDFLKKKIKELGGWPTIDSYWNEKTFDWITLLERFQRMGASFSIFYGIYIGVDEKNSSTKLITITQMGIYYERIKKGMNDTHNKALFDFRVELCMLFGADRATAIADVTEIMNFESEIAKIYVPEEQRRNASLLYNVMTIRELHKKFPFLPWLKLINMYLAPVDAYTPDDVVNFKLPQYFKKLESLLLIVKKRVVANYLFTAFTRRLVYLLPKRFEKIDLDFVRTVYGINELPPRWKVCVSFASRLNKATSSMYVKKYVNKRVKHKVTELIIDIKSAFLENLKKTTWMDRKTKKHAILKAEQMQSFVGFPDELLDDKLVNEEYEGLELNPNEHIIMIMFNISIYMHISSISELRSPFLKNNWKDQTYSFMINAWYSPITNYIYLPAALLQDSFYDSDRPQYLNYGSLGYIIGHEITHGFDSWGRQYDKEGNLVDWWESETNITFSKRSKCLEEQYGNYTIPEIGMNVNGVKTLPENIADNGGVKMAYRGYMKWLERNGNEAPLPGLPYTPRQLFWVAAGWKYCVKYKTKVLKEMVRWEHHSPPYFRVMVPLMNSDHFGRDFNCPIGAPMNPKYKCRVW